MSTRRASGIALWIVQMVLAALFLFAGGFKLATPTTELARMTAPLSAGFIKFIGVCEVLGALGLVLPGLFRLRLALTPLAAAGLVIIMLGAVIVTAITQSVAGAVFPLVVSLLATLVALGRRSPAARAI
jgi:DoxX-like protein